MRDASGAPLSGRAVTWTSSAPTVAAVSSSGVVTGLTPGNAVITATSEGKSGTATITVLPPAPVNIITVQPATGTIRRALSMNLTAQLLDAAGNVLTGRTIAWSSSDTNIATVTSAGPVATVTGGIRTGTAVITATSEGKHGDATILVTQ